MGTTRQANRELGTEIEEERWQLPIPRRLRLRFFFLPRLAAHGSPEKNGQNCRFSVREEMTDVRVLPRGSEHEQIA